MPSLSEFKLVLDQLKADVAQAWPDITRIYVGEPRDDEGQPAYAVIVPRPTDGDWGSAQAVLFPLVFDIFLVQAVPVDKILTLIDEKIARINALAPLLEASPEYAGVGMYPVLSGFDLGERGDELEDIMELGATFSVRVMPSWGE